MRPGRHSAQLLLAALWLLAAGCREEPVTEAAAAAALGDGWELFRLGDYARATTAFSRAVAGAPGGSTRRAQALFSLAVSHDLRRPGEDPVGAAALYRQVIAEFPRSDWAAWSRLALARQLEVEAIDEPAPLARLESAYGEVIDAHPGHDAAIEAFLHLQGARIGTCSNGPVARAAADLERFVAERPVGPYVSTVWRLLADARHVQGRGEARVEALIRADETVEEVASESRDPTLAWWRIATAAQFDVGDFATARTYYRRIIEKYPTDSRVFFARQLLREMDELEARLRTERTAAQAGGGAP